MPEFYANWSRMIVLSGELKKCSTNMISLIDRTSTIRNNLILGNELYQIQSALEKSNCELNRIALIIGKSSDVMEQAADIYKSTETQLLGENESLKNKSDNTAADTSSDEQENDLLDWLDEIFKIVGKIGAIGSGIESIYKIIFGFINGKDYGIDDFIKYGSDVVSSISSTISGFIKDGKDIFDKLFAFPAKVEKIDKVSWSNYFGDNIKEQMGDYIGKSGKGVAVCEWLGLATSLISNGIDNYNEFGNNMSLEAIEETVIETATDILLNTAAKAAVGGVVALLGLSPPGLVVGIASVILVDGANALSKHFTNKSLTEWAADGGTWLINNIGKGIVDTAVGDATKDFFANAQQSASNLFHFAFG